MHSAHSQGPVQKNNPSVADGVKEEHLEKLKICRDTY